MALQLVEEPGQFLAAARLLQLADSLGLDLADALAGHLEDVADFFQRVAVAVAQAVTELDDFPFAVAERLQDLVDAACEASPRAPIAGLSTPESGSKSPKWLSSLLPTGRSRLIG